MALMLLMGTSSAWAATISSDGTARLYFNMSSINWWISGNGNNNFAYFFNNSTGKNSWSAHSVQHDGNTYYVTIPKGDWAGVILTRNNTTTAPSWNNKWNQTGDITLSSASNYISKFSEGSASVTWGTAVKPASTASVTAASANIKAGESTTLSAALTSNTDINTFESATYTTTDGASISDNTFTSTTPGTYTVTATITYYPNGYSSLTSTATATTTITVESACTPATSITSATLRNGTISLVGNFTTCGAKYHGFQWRKSTADWCNDGDESQDFSNYVKIGNTEGGEGEVKDFTPESGVTYVFRTYIYNNGSWIYSSEIKEVEVPCPTINAPTFSVSSKIACKNVAFNLNDLFPRTDSGAGTLEWYKKDGTKVAAPTSVSISSTTQYYAVLKDGLCSSANSSNVTVNIYTPAISNIKITPYSYGITVQATITGSDLQSMIVECIEKGGDWVNAKKCNQNLKGSGNATCSIDGLVAGTDYQVRISANTKTCSEIFTYSAVQDVKTTCDEIPDAPDIITSGVVCPNTNITLSDYNNGIVGVKWYSNPECTTPASATVSISSNKKYYARIEDGGCASDASTLSLTLYPTPQTPVVTFSANPVAQNKPTTLTVGEYNGTLNNYTLYKDGDSQGACAASQEITIGQAGEYDYRVVATSKACPSLTATSETVTLKVQEAGAKIVQLGDLTIYTNIKTDFVPMYVQKDGIVDVDGASSVKGYTWQYSQDGNSWSNCTTNYASGVVGMSNGGADCNNWRADKAGRYRCLITYDNDGTQYSNVLSVAAATKTAPAVNAFGDLPIISVNTGSNSFPSDAGLSYKTTKCETKRYPSVHADKLKAKISVDVKIYDKTGKLQYDRKARMNYRGSSSLNFQKKSYAFVTGKEKTKNDKGDVDTGKANLFGLSNGCEDKDWVLYAATPDPSMMRNRLVFDLYKQMRPGEWGVNSMYVELIVNNEYKGVYVLMDKITNNVDRVNITSSGGFIVKFDKTDVEDRVENTEGDQKTFATSRTGTKNSSNGIESYGACIDQRFEIEYPEKEDVEDAGGNWEATYSAIQKRFEDFETALEEKDYSTVRSIIDYDSWADWFILSEFIKNQDGFRASNIFIYDGGKIKATPLWDQELSMDNRTRIAHGSNNAEGLLTTTSSVYTDNFPATFWFTGNNGSSITGGLLKDPCFVSLVKSKWATYHEGILSPSNISGMVADYEEELGNAKTREATKWPYTQAVRGTTTDGDYVGYYSDGEGDPSHYSFAASKNAINSWATNRSTPLGENTNGLGEALYNLEGEALIFTVSPSTVETTPWQQVILTVNAPEGYEYTVSYPDLTAAGAIIKEGNNTYGIKIPRPDGWGTAGNGDPDDPEEYEFTANIEVSGENACGTMQDGTATSTITLKDVTEECKDEIKP